MNITRENIIETKELAHKQGSKFLLQDINWTVQEGEHWVVFGANGCGKTTLLSTVAGYRSYNKGECYLFGEKLTKDNAVHLRSQVGFVSSSYLDRCFNHESGLDIVLSAKFGGFGRKYDITDADVAKARQLLQSLGVAQKADYPYNMLSQGQRQRVLLARALMVPPKLLLLDEPLTGLDIIARDFFLNTLQEIVKTTDVTVVYVTHHAEEILPFYQKAMLLKNGKIYAQGDKEAVFSNETMGAFFGHPTKVDWSTGKPDISIGEEMRMPKAIWARETKESW